jgi:hypothetical protein
MKQITNKMSKASWALRLLLVLSLILVPPFLQAKELTELEVRAAVETWVRYVTADARPDAVVEKMEPYTVEGKTVAYIAHLSGGGFCLCGANDLVLPVYFYASHGIYDPKNPILAYFLSEITTRTERLSRGIKNNDPEMQPYAEALARRAEFWQKLIARIPPEKREVPKYIAEPDSMTLPLSCLWDQGSPYNDSCPVLTPGTDTHTAVGCVPTAMSQIMYFWKWPHTGVGSIVPPNGGWYPRKYSNVWLEEPLANDPHISGQYWIDRLDWDSTGMLRMKGYWDVSILDEAYGISSDTAYRRAVDTLFYNRLIDDREWLSANFGATTYNWSIMQDDHTDPPDSSGDAEVARLCNHAGVAVGVRYGLEGTSGDDMSAGVKMGDYFRYYPGAFWRWTDIDSMTLEIQWFRPLIMGGGGHAWVTFGYNKLTDPDRQFRMNLGWGYVGGQDGWYTCDGVFPSGQGHDVRIAPLSVKFVGASDPGDGSPLDPYQNIEEAIVEAPDSSTLIFKAGSDNTFSAATLVINRPLTLKGRDVTIRKQ